MSKDNYLTHDVTRPSGPCVEQYDRWMWVENGDLTKAIFFRHLCSPQCNTVKEIAERMKPYDGCVLVKYPRLFLPYTVD